MANQAPPTNQSLDHFQGLCRVRAARVSKRTLRLFCVEGCPLPYGRGSDLLCAVASIALLASLTASACGYRLAGSSAPALPQSLQTIAVPAFQNQTFQFKIEQKLTAAVMEEFLSRTSYRVQSETEGSDAVLEGTVTAIYSSPIVYDPISGRTTEVLMNVSLRVRLVEIATGQVLYEANDLLFRESYEVSTDPNMYFGENQAALDRLSRDVAATLVAAILGKRP